MQKAAMLIVSYYLKQNLGFVPERCVYYITLNTWIPLQNIGLVMLRRF